MCYLLWLLTALYFNGSSNNKRLKQDGGSILLPVLRVQIIKSVLEICIVTDEIFFILAFVNNI